MIGCTQHEKDLTTKETYSVPQLMQASLGESEKVYTPQVKEFEVRLEEDLHKDDNEEEIFFPATFKVKEGDTVRMSFLLDQPRFIMIEGYDFAENMYRETVEFTADKTGRFTIVCFDCEDKPTADLIVE